jgi:hypothetical protein
VEVSQGCRKGPVFAGMCASFLGGKKGGSYKGWPDEIGGDFSRRTADAYQE